MGSPRDFREWRGRQEKDSHVWMSGETEAQAGQENTRVEQHNSSPPQKKDTPPLPQDAPGLDDPSPSHLGVSNWGGGRGTPPSQTPHPPTQGRKGQRSPP